MYFKDASEENDIVPEPAYDDVWLKSLLPTEHRISFEERIILLLALIPHLCPQLLDIFFSNNKLIDRPYTEFGGYRGLSHGGFLPTGETAAFLIAGNDVEKRMQVVGLFNNRHWFYTENIIRLEGKSDGEPPLSGKLKISEEILSKIYYNSQYEPDYSVDFPAKIITTALEWDDMVLNYNTMNGLEEICTWLTHNKTIIETWKLSRFLKAGYRSLFYGPSGTGKTLAATLIGKRNGMSVYRIDLSMIVSKYIGETEKNLGKIFDMAENRNWILFFDEADALFAKRTATNTSNDRYANQEVAFLLQRIEDFSGTILLATNLLSNIDDAFLRRFQSVIYFPMPDKEMRKSLWQMMLPQEWLKKSTSDILNIAADYPISGGVITNVIRHCALNILSNDTMQFNEKLLLDSIEIETNKGK
ncbi:MAG: ATP-binding protein [Culturomica sp.]|jgi:hypothetical protein|nr:ATP-binding protein [Culturomica sp.]